MGGGTRRWFLEVGAGVVLTGFHGTAPAEGTLPPGLYLPSVDHLGHALRRSGENPLAGYRLQFFTPDEDRLLRRVLMVLLGDVPNRDQVIAGIVNWIDLTVQDSAAVRAAALALSPMHLAVARAYSGAAAVEQLRTFDAQRVCREGLAALSASPGVDSDAGLAAALRTAGDERPDRARDDAATRFFAYVKAQAIHGYYTSPQGLRELDYKGNAFYTDSPGCDRPA
jgi:hypothetical protein